MHRQTKDYSTLKLLLETQETFPLQFTYKFIGRNTPAFKTSVEGLERAFPGMKHQMTRKSSNDQHTALTYSYEAVDAEDVINVFKGIEQVADLLIIL